MNSQQKRAIETVDGRVLVLAGAGSGKTRVLTHRIAHLITHLKVPPEAILGLTFTNKAAVEMRHRMSVLIGESLAKNVTLATFHSFCLEVLRNDIERLGYTTNFTLYNEQDVKRLMNYITRDILGHQADLPSFAKAEALIQQATAQGKKSEEIVDASSKWHEQYVRTLFERLEEAMRAHNAVDFDRLLTLTVTLLEEHSDLLAKYQDLYRYIMIDEYQDTNPIQYKLVSLLAAKYNNLCVVGDDDQSIYGWRGADMRNILEFEGETVIKLEQNYRSTNVILKVANAVISKNTKRHKKVLWSECGEGYPVEVFVAASDVEEAEAVANRLTALKEKEKLCWKDIAILYRSNSLARPFELALMKKTWYDGNQWRMGIPYELYGSTELYERREVKDLQAYLRFIVNPLDQEALLRIINQPRRGIGEASLDKLTSYNRLHRKPLWEVIQKVCAEDSSFAHLVSDFPVKVKKSLKDFVSIVEEAVQQFSVLPLAKALEWLIQRIAYKTAIREEVKSDQMREFKWQNVTEFVNTLAAYEQNPSEKEPLARLADFVAQFPLGSQYKNPIDSFQDKVQLMTLHSSKGLEFPACFLVGIEDHIIPHERSAQEGNVEEERRLMYVGITRAMKFLTLSMAAKRMKMGKEEVVRPSRFLFDIPPNLLNRSKPI